MREKLQLYIEKVTTFWKSRTLAQKSVMIGAIIGLFVLIIGVSAFASNTKMVPLYSNLSLQEVGQIKEELDTRNIKYEISNGGQSVLVPQEQVDSLLVDLAAQGLPNSGNIDYSFFSANTSWGMTDNEFDVIKLDAMQTELATLISSIDGIRDAKVMINKPKESVFVGEQQQQASASVVIQKEGGYDIDQNKVKSLYNLVSKSVPNLSTDNIVITDQSFTYYDLENEGNMASGNTYEYQQGIKKDIERDIQQRVQKMLGMMIGRNKVVVSVTADVDFTKENRTENLVQPSSADGEEGLPVSVERITETYTGNPPVGGTPGTGEEDVPNYDTAEGEGDGSYEMMKETINNEYNRIQRNIVESPYKLRDLGIQVAVDNSKAQTENTESAESLSTQEQNTVSESVTSILSSIVETSISDEYGEVEPSNKISVVFEEFNGQPQFEGESKPVIPTWLYAIGGVMLVIIATLIWMLAKGNKKKAVKEEYVAEAPVSVPDIEEEQETEASLRRKQLERMAKDKPEDFAKLLRSWIAED
ncbi:flagellar basal body M-ring protein FliF [Pontibacillus yanchengensis]|uniref:Flagellar M-ring protein n=2 Tax=Pontibacillus yanchengensis TaxID=462910 RepID=A0A6I5A3C0_9BACI|nr:flagellar basal-body MS-ring/collar protein FliF [Pontibacillus yanchengensis]MYL33139.1 flagellar basal body M-ring protein FliF [Pontibacillus yanchengensis]MYL52011.1 flagellar basal body M-ring protein FliF [Pontibacillus yanchengensis]